MESQLAPQPTTLLYCMQVVIVLNTLPHKIGLGREEVFRIFLAIKKLYQEHQLASVRFWGESVFLLLPLNTYVINSYDIYILMFSVCHPRQDVWH